ncbi:UNVERIFIED_CONTAM: hypothetical protein Sradi_0009300 [Sesamum radiatum]|uniref:TF-B3 domain-containing protein n=1 Tax=Sesamum radiatum TaxID=300843 RepID=A0AAW2WFW8_SESRA
MWEVDHLDDDDGSRSVSNRRWEYLIHVTKLLFEGKVELEQLVNQVENPNPEAARVGDQDPLVRGFLKKGKRSPRKGKMFIQTPAPVVDRVDDSPQPGKESGPKSTFGTNPGKTPAVVCTQQSISKKISIKKPADVEAPKTSTTADVSNLENLDKKPVSTCRRRKIHYEHGESSSQNPRAKKRAVAILNFPHPEPILPEAFKNHILETGGCLETLVFVIQKGLFKTDLDPNEGRLSIPYRQVQNQFLESSELEQLDSTPGGIPATLVEPCLEERKMSLRNWKSNSMYALVSGWNEVCSRNALRRPGVVIQLWSFRRHTHLCFALIDHQSSS